MTDKAKIIVFGSIIENSEGNIVVKDFTVDFVIFCHFCRLRSDMSTRSDSFVLIFGFF